MPEVYKVRTGDSLDRIARRFGTSVDALAQANGIKNLGDLVAGQRLTIPDHFQTGPARSGADAADGFSGPATRAGVNLGSVQSSTGRTFETSSDGTPMFRQGDAEWGRRMLGDSASISHSGCAMVATAMAISKISGHTFTPAELDKYLDRHRGYSGDALKWNVAARAAGLGVERPNWSVSRLGSELDAGRPVAIGIDYKKGSLGGANGTDHWITVTHREQDAQGATTYFANDPATGREITLREVKGKLLGESGVHHYKSTGLMVTFTGG